MSQLRWNPMLREWVAVASHRQVRPIALGNSGPAENCPFCPGGAEGLNAPYEIVCFENKYPSFVREPGQQAASDGRELYKTAPGRGVCEVVVYSPNHDSTLADESTEHIHRLVKVWTDRYREIGAVPFVKYVYIFENKGAVIGVTLSHPHGQIYAFPYIPPKVKVELDSERRYMRSNRSCLLCDMVRNEIREGVRLVSVNRHFAAFVPHFAKYPYEIHIVSRRHLGHLADMTQREQWSLAGILKTILVKYDGLFGFPFPYMMLMHQTPTDGKRHKYHHFHIEFFPPHRSREKIKYLAGCESGAGTFINDTIPEEKAAELRKAGLKGSRKRV